MKRERQTPEEIIKKLREAATQLAGGRARVDRRKASLHGDCQKKEPASKASGI